MSDTTSTGGDAGQGTNTDGGAQNQGGDGKNQQQSGDRGSSGQGGQSGSGAQGASDKTFTQAELDDIVAKRIARERQKYADYDDLKAAADASKPLGDQVSKLQKDLAARDAKDAERNGKLALSTVHALLAEQGIRKDDVKDVLDRFDPKSLLKDGEPDDDAITTFARGLARVAGRTTPDPDQGQGGSGSSPQTMGDFMRQMARNRR